MNDEKNKITKIKLSTLIYSMVAFGLLLSFVAVIFVYKFSKDNFIDSRFGDKIIFPAIVINNRSIITIKEISDNLRSIRRFYENQDFASLGYRVDFSTEAGKKRLKIREKDLINKMVEDRAIEILAKERGIKVTKKMVNDAVNRRISEIGGDKRNVEKNLNKLYGWSLGKFKEKVVMPSLYKEQLKKWVELNAGKDKKKIAKENIENAKKELDKGESFEDVANKKNGIQSKGGHIGWFKKEFVDKKLQEIIVEMNVGETSNIIETELGYHILKLNKTKKDKNGEKLYDISQIFFPKLTFADWLDFKIKKMNVKIFLSDYVWISKKGMVDFKDSNMKDFEKKVMNNPQRDISLMVL